MTYKDEQKARETDITLTAGEFLDALKQVVKVCGRDQKIGITIPYRNGIGVHWEYIKNISFHERYVDIHTTIPAHDDVK